jgi:hypothetical protein
MPRASSSRRTHAAEAPTSSSHGWHRRWAASFSRTGIAATRGSRACLVRARDPLPFCLGCRALLKANHGRGLRVSSMLPPFLPWTVPSHEGDPWRGGRAVGFFMMGFDFAGLALRDGIHCVPRPRCGDGGFMSRSLKHNLVCISSLDAEYEGWD